VQTSLLGDIAPDDTAPAAATTATPDAADVQRRTSPRMHPSWLAVLEGEMDAPHMRSLRAFLAAEKAAGRTFFPPSDRVFNALWLTPFEDVRVVVLGQDPYHGPGQAMGLSFSVPPGVAPPPSLVNIFKELGTDLGLPTPTSGDLTPWAEQGVLLLNAVLTVAPRQAGSHAGKGWEQFTDRVVRELSDRRDGLVFLLWGRYAQQKGAVVDRARHHVLEAAHPSPFSATRFFGCRHFSRANALLEAAGRAPVDWRLP
jgi:uracil-DNA glycosylase